MGPTCTSQPFPSCKKTWATQCCWRLVARAGRGLLRALWAPLAQPGHPQLLNVDVLQRGGRVGAVRRLCAVRWGLASPICVRCVMGLLLLAIPVCAEWREGYGCVVLVQAIPPLGPKITTHTHPPACMRSCSPPSKHPLHPQLHPSCTCSCSSPSTPLLHLQPLTPMHLPPAPAAAH